MRFFGKLVLISNLCFLISAIFHYLKLYVQANATNPQPLDVFKGTIVIIAEFAWILNFLFLLIVLIVWLVKKQNRVGKWLVIINAVIFIFQIYFYFKDSNDTQHTQRQTHSAIYFTSRNIYY